MYELKLFIDDLIAAIILPEQSVASEKAGLAVSKKGLTLKELLQQTSHHNAKVRKGTNLLRLFLVGTMYGISCSLLHSKEWKRETTELLHLTFLISYFVFRKKKNKRKKNKAVN